MIDPMADIDHASPVGPEMDGGGSGGDGNQEVFDTNAYKSNFAKMDRIRSFMGIASGCVAGVCGLTGLGGLGELFLRPVVRSHLFIRADVFPSCSRHLPPPPVQ
jgi:hypothetical protein